jgi:two-component system, NtrC family, response regulator HydG
MALRDSIADDPTIASSRSGGFTAGSFALVVIEGPDAGRSFDVDADLAARLLIGKSPACDFRLSDQEVSRRHASLELTGRRLRLKDLGSTNGTFVDGIGIVEAFLRGGEIVRLGTTALRVDERGPPREVTLPARVQFGGVLGASTAMRRIYSLCDRLAAADVPVVIEGETGTGKEQLALALHEKSGRSSGPFVVFDCTAVAPNLIESELFGHERGAFTGSVATRKGVFERAHGGTLLIDEIGDLPLDLQPKLLRAIERGEIARVGGERRIRVDVRLLCATRRDLDREVAAGRFRDDLFHRIAVARIELPPLRDRHGDVALLAAWFCRELDAKPDALPKELLKRWNDYDWPGNVRELRNAVARRLALGDLADDLVQRASSDDDPTPAAAPDARLGHGGGDVIAGILRLGLPLAEARQRLIDHFEERYLEHVLEQHGGNVTRAAAAAGVARRHLQRLRAKRER